MLFRPIVAALCCLRVCWCVCRPSFRTQNIVPGRFYLLPTHEPAKHSVLLQNTALTSIPILPRSLSLPLSLSFHELWAFHFIWFNCSISSLSVLRKCIHIQLYIFRFANENEYTTQNLLQSGLSRNINASIQKANAFHAAKKKNNLNWERVCLTPNSMEAFEWMLANWMQTHVSHLYLGFEIDTHSVLVRSSKSAIVSACAENGAGESKAFDSSSTQTVTVTTNNDERPLFWRTNGLTNSVVLESYVCFSFSDSPVSIWIYFVCTQKMYLRGWQHDHQLSLLS